MYLRLVRFTLTESAREQVLTMAEDLVPAIKQQPGCVSAVFYGSADGESGLCVLWDTQEHADAAAQIVSPRLQAHLAGHVIAPAGIGLFPVIAN